MRIYLSAPISGVDNHAEIFDTMSAIVRSQGAVPVNPLEIEPKCDGCPTPRRLTNKLHSWECFLRWDLQVMLDCDAVFFYRTWQFSPGCRFEHHVAVTTGMTILHWSPAMESQ